MLGRIGEWVLRRACKEAASWPEDVGIAVNVCPRQLRDPGFIVTLVSALTQAGLEPSRLELEVTETVFLELTGATQKVLQQIQSLGVRLAMDDFGTGYSSLGYLRQAEFRHAEDRPELRPGHLAPRTRKAPRSSAPWSRWPAASA